MNAPRRQGREAALQILYFSEVGRAEPEAAVEAFFAEHMPEADEDVRAFAAQLVIGVTSDLETLDRTIERHTANWRIERLAIVDRIVLRIASWELAHEPETPPAVVINEAIELARRFSGDESVKFVNGVLDAIRRAEPASGQLAPGSDQVPH